MTISTFFLNTLCYLHRAVLKKFLHIFSHTRSGHSLWVWATNVTTCKSAQGTKTLWLNLFPSGSSWQANSPVTHLPLSRASARFTSLLPSSSCAAHRPKTHALCSLDFIWASLISRGFVERKKNKSMKTSKWKYRPNSWITLKEFFF